MILHYRKAKKQKRLVHNENQLSLSLLEAVYVKGDLNVGTFKVTINELDEIKTTIKPMKMDDNEQEMDQQSNVDDEFYHTEQMDLFIQYQQPNSSDESEFENEDRRHV